MPDGRDGFAGWGGVGGEVEGFNGGEEGGFARVVEAEEEDGVFCFFWLLGGAGCEEDVGREVKRRWRWHEYLLCSWRRGRGIWLGGTL